MTTFKQICDDYEENNRRPPRFEINPEILSQDPTHFDKKKGWKVKIFSDTWYGKNEDRSVTAEIMEGIHNGAWTTCYEKDLELLKK